MAAKFDYDFSGYATKAGVRCYDGLTIAPNAFSECDGEKVPVVWNHDHSDPEHVLGHAMLQNRKDGVYAYVKLNDTPSGRSALECVKSGDIEAMSIFANGLQKAGQTVMHGIIREVSLVIAGCNPGAYIDEIVAHSADNADSYEAYIYDDRGLSLKHGLDPEGNPLDEDKKKEEKKMAREKTVEEVFNEFTEEQKNVVYAIVGAALDEKESGNGNGNKEDADMKHNVFDRYGREDVLAHSMDEINAAVADLKRVGSMREAFQEHGLDGDALAHSIDQIDWLYPDDHLLDTPPRIIDRDQSWVAGVINGVHHVPFSRFKSMFADLTEDDARAKGYIKGNYKKEQVFGLLKRRTEATTVYKKQRFDRDDLIEITSFDVVAWIKKEMRTKLDEEIATAILVGDGRPASSDDKINEQNIRPIYNDDDLFTIKIQVDAGAGADATAKMKAVIRAIIKARKDYKGSGNPTFFTTEDVLTDMLLMEDTLGHPLYKGVDELCNKLRVSKIVTVPRMENMKGAKGGEFIGLVVNLADYTVGADKGGAVNMFDDFDIDYNQQKYLIETRCSGALTVPFSAIAVEMKNS